MKSFLRLFLLLIASVVCFDAAAEGYAAADSSTRAGHADTVSSPLDLSLPRVRTRHGNTAISLGLFTYDKQVSGAQFGLLGAGIGHRLGGVQVSALYTLTRGETVGVQFAPVFNYAREMRGFQFSSLFNLTERAARGLQLSSVTNLSIEGDGLLQTAVTNIVLGRLRGAQIGLTNYAGKLSGVQIGIANVAGHSRRGVQIGVINSTRDSSATKIGLVNYTPATRVQMMVFGGNTTKSNLAVRFLNHHFYTLLGFGLYYRGLDDRFSGSLFYRAGYYHDLPRRWAVSGDLGIAHIEDAAPNVASQNTRMLGWQARLNAEHRFSRRFSLFASGGWSVARYYKSRARFHSKPIFELGILLF